MYPLLILYHFIIPTPNSHFESYIFYIYVAVDGLHQQLPEQLAVGADHHHAPDARRDHVLSLRGRVGRIKRRLVRRHEAAPGAGRARGLDKRHDKRRWRGQQR